MLFVHSNLIFHYIFTIIAFHILSCSFLYICYVLYFCFLYDDTVLVYMFFIYTNNCHLINVILDAYVYGYAKPRVVTAYFSNKQLHYFGFAQHYYVVIYTYYFI